MSRRPVHAPVDSTANLEDTVRHNRLAIVLVAAAVAPIATAAGATLEPNDREPRNLAAEAATGDVDAMRAVVQDIVDCLREKGLNPGDAEVRGASVAIGDWNPAWGSAADRATHDCAF